jgi:hypothetical protein
MNLIRFLSLQTGVWVLANKSLYLYMSCQGTIFQASLQKEVADFRTVSERQTGGFYMDAGIGYRIRLGLLHNLSFSTGYVRKSVSHEKIYTNPCGIVPCTDPPPTPDEYFYRYNYGLITTKLSWEWGN